MTQPYDKEFYSSQNTLEREEYAYQAHKSEWDKQYAGEWIALHKGEVVCHHKDKSKITELLIGIQKKRGRFRAYLVHIGDSLVGVRGPTRHWLGKAVKN